MGTDRNNSNVMENVDKFGKTNKDTSRRDFADKQNPGDKWSRSNEDHIQSLGQNNWKFQPRNLTRNIPQSVISNEK